MSNIEVLIVIDEKNFLIPLHNVNIDLLMKNKNIKCYFINSSTVINPPLVINPSTVINPSIVINSSTVINPSIVINSSTVINTPTVINPPLVINDYIFLNTKKEKITVHVIRDDLLLGGTKQRGLYDYLAKNVAQEFVYAGPPNGYAQLALAYCCSLLNKKATIFLAGDKSVITRKALSFHNVKVIAKRQKLEVMQKEAQNYVAQNPESKLIPFGLDSPEYINDLVVAIKKSSMGTLLENPGKIRLWTVVGSGTLLKAFGQVWPEAEFFPVRVGKNIWEDQFEPNLWQRMGGRRRIDELRVVPDEKLPKIAGHQYQNFWDPAPNNMLPPFPALIDYDAKVWQRVLQYAQDGDYVWSVAGNITF